MIIFRHAVVADMEKLAHVAGADKHVLVRPTHIIEREKDDELLGYVSVGAVPMVVMYMRPNTAKARESFQVEQECERLVAASGAPFLCMPCAMTSPFYKYLPRLGFTSFGLHDMFMKAI